MGMIEGRRVLPSDRKPRVLEYNRRGLSAPPPKGFVMFALNAAAVSTIILVLIARAERLGPFSFHCSLTRQVMCRQDFSELELSLDSFDIDLGRYPTNEEGLSALLEVPPGTEAHWRGPYIEPQQVRDPWGRVFIYYVRGAAPHDSYHLASRGPDGFKGTKDDLATAESVGP